MRLIVWSRYRSMDCGRRQVAGEHRDGTDFRYPARRPVDRQPARGRDLRARRRRLQLAITTFRGGGLVTLFDIISVPLSVVELV
jgi:hypothetical protein